MRLFNAAEISRFSGKTKAGCDIAHYNSKIIQISQEFSQKYPHRAFLVGAFPNQDAAHLQLTVWLYIFSLKNYKKTKPSNVVKSPFFSDTLLLNAWNNNHILLESLRMRRGWTIFHLTSSCQQTRGLFCAFSWTSALQHLCWVPLQECQPRVKQQHGQTAARGLYVARWVFESGLLNLNTVY